MNRYLKLVHFELMRFKFIYFSLIGMTLLSQFWGLYSFVTSSVRKVEIKMKGLSLTEAEYVQQFGLDDIQFSHFVNQSMWFIAPVVLCIAALVFYVFMIWYRDWLGKNMFVYRLLMVPTKRSNIFLAKASVILLTVLGLIALQMLIMPLQIRTFNALVPDLYKTTMMTFDVIFNSAFLKNFIPRSFLEFVLYYGAGMFGVIVVFTAILIERSYRLKGLIAGIVYCILVGFVFFLPMIISENWFPNFLYVFELFIIQVIVGIFLSGASMWLSFYLLKNKVTV